MTFERTFVLALMCVAGCSSHPVPVTPAASVAQANADSATRDPARFLDVFQRESAPMVREGNYLAVLQLLDRLTPAPGASLQLRSLWGQYAGTYEQFLGGDSVALQRFAIGRASPIAFDTAALQRLKPVDAATAVIAASRGRRAVFVNEAHHMPMHRAFTRRLLEPLYHEGFRYLAVETLDTADKALNQRNYPVRGSGFYSNEPTFGAMLRAARQIGFTLVPYEHAAREQAERERGQAANIARIFAQDSTARVLVHAGYSHIDESGKLGGADPMAVQFRGMTGIDPLTVDQTVLSDMGEPRLLDARYPVLIATFHPTAPVALANGDSLWSAKPGVHDITVLQPRVAYREGRPTWRWAPGVRALHLDPDVCGPKADECVVTARIASEAPDAVPVDALRVGPGRSRTLLLPAGLYTISVRNAANVETARWPASVP